MSITQQKLLKYQLYFS